VKPRDSETNPAHQLLCEIADQTAHVLEEGNVSPELARIAGVRVADAIAATFGGMNLYIPANAVAKNAARDLEIAGALVDSDAFTVSQSFGISMSAVYRAAKRAEARRGIAKGGQA
jgi:Mor family transcriptional regulator